MKKYDAYKDSGVKWIGEIPNHWEVVPLKRTGSFENGLTYFHQMIFEIKDI